MHLRPELLRAEQHEPEITSALGDIEEHLPDVRVLSIVRRVLVELIDEDDQVFHAEIAALEMLTQSRYDAREDQVLRVFFERSYVHYIHLPVFKAPEGKIAHVSGIGNKSG